MGSVQLRHGDVFDGPSDLIVLPCSTSGTVTPLVAERLNRHKISARPSYAMLLGDVQISFFDGGQSIASYVAYAASVGDFDSDAQALKEIGIKLGRISADNQAISRIAVPLLGTGAGGLDPQIAFRELSQSFLKSSSQTAILIVSVLNENSFKILSQTEKIPTFNINLRPSQDTDTTPPRVFINYSHTDNKHTEWVRLLGEFLRQNGVDARIDVWFLRAGMDLPQFMTNELTLADRVIVICDERYAEKADGRLGGVGWETMIIQGDMSQQPVTSTKYMSIVRSSSLAEGTPIYLKSKLAMHWPPDANEKPLQRNLLQEIFNTIRAPAIGPRPTDL